VKKDLLALSALIVAVIVTVGVAVAATDSDDATNSLTRDVSGEDERVANPGNGALGVCIGGVVDCVDTVVDPSNDVCIQIFPVPPECGGDGGWVSPDEPVSNDPPTSIDDIDPNECNLVHNIDACEQQATLVALEDLSARLGVEVESIAVISAEFVQWPDACIGAAQPDEACAEIITPGFKIALESGGQSFVYHTDTGTRAALVD